MRKFSIIIPVYNRPRELDEALDSLVWQTYQNFEVLVIEDGSENKSDEVVKQYSDRLDIRYFYKTNSGQGFSRNLGLKNATGDYFIIFDSDIIVPERYLEMVNHRLDEDYLDAFGGPDRDHPTFSPIQKAISYAMTSPFTTGGIRGGKKRLSAFHPRSFNMGLSRAVYETCGGFAITRMAEDLEYSIRIIRAGFRVGLISEAFVYHKRRTSFKQFFRQLHFFGRGRINIYRFYPDQLKLVHVFPTLFVAGLVILILSAIISLRLFLVIASVYALYFLIIFIHSGIKYRNPLVAAMSVFAAFIQLTAYGTGFVRESLKLLKKK